MPRIRTIKPEILTDEKSAALTDTEWRLFVSCIVMADDYGNFRASPAFLHSQVFWSSSTSREDCLKARVTLARLSLIVLYEVEGQQYGHISGWAKHQRVDHPGKPICPREPSRESQEKSRDSREDAPQVPDSSCSREPRESLAPDLEGDQEKEGKGNAPRVSGKIRPRTAHDLEHCLRVAVQREQKTIWNPGGSFAAKEAREFLEGFGDQLEEALADIEARIDLFAKDTSMNPWTIAKFSKAYNGIGKPKPDQRNGKPALQQARY